MSHRRKKYSSHENTHVNLHFLFSSFGTICIFSLIFTPRPDAGTAALVRVQGDVQLVDDDRQNT